MYSPCAWTALVPSPPNGEKNCPRPLKLKSPVRPAPYVGPIFTPTIENFLLRRCDSSTAPIASVCAMVVVSLLGERLGQRSDLISQRVVLRAELIDLSPEFIVFAL